MTGTATSDRSSEPKCNWSSYRLYTKVPSLSTWSQFPALTPAPGRSAGPVAPSGAETRQFAGSFLRGPTFISLSAKRLYSVCQSSYGLSCPSE